MEKRKNSLSALKICRFCLCQDETLTSLYDRIRKPKNATSLSLKILSCLSMEVFPSDKMPAYICQQCNFFMDLMYNYKDMCRRADEKIMQYVQRGSALDSMSWPTSLSKVYRLGLKTNPNLIQLTSQEVSDSEEEENNVYNIKIGDGTEEGAESIQLIASKGEDMDKIKPAKEIMSCEADSEEEDAKDTAETDGLWPCDECDCTYPLRQLLQLHKKQKHRPRNVACEQCDAKFFSKYDLQMHMVRHSDEMLFQCVACCKRFKRLVLLKRHEKIMHSDIPQLACPNCPATFLSLEELTAHQEIHNRNTDRSVSCHLCNKKFLDQNTRSRHMKMVHPHQPSFHCEYCPAQFTTIANLVRHVRSHAGDRPYPCRHCDKKFTKSHHYTRHLREKHRVPMKRAREERYRCEQCDESFFSQDELIYHSAIHATQNLTCPLCQEKFEDVDAVTAHIKSHVNGTEFMCDLCELVFTSKEKLDGHLTIAHAEELDNDESSMEMEAEDDEDDNTINVKEEDGQMVVEIKKPEGFMLAEPLTNADVKTDNNINSEESEPESSYTELSTVDTLAIVRKKPAPAAAAEKPATVPIAMGSVTITKVTSKTAEPAATAENVTASILRKAEEVKRKAQQISSEPVAEKKVPKVESSTAGASDKSLRLLEKELQELKRTNPRNEVSKTPVRSMETLRNRRPQLHTSTPKTRATEEKKLLAATKSPATDKKVPDRPERSERPERKAVTKENKEPKETKEIKEIKSTPVKEEKKKEEEVKEKETPKSVVKNGTNDKSQPEETVRRSTRPSKIKDYAKMIRDKSQESDDDSDDADDEEYKEVEKTESRGKTRRSSIKTMPKAAAPAPPAAAASPAAVSPAPAAATPAASPATPAPPRKRGRPRKDQSAQKAVPSKMKKEEPEEEEEAVADKMETEVSKPAEPAAEAEKNAQSSPTPTETAENTPAGNEANQSPSCEQKSAAGGVLVSPTGQTLKKVPIKALPPGVKPFPLPSRPLGTGELCEMQIGKKMVKVQKIVMTKAEVEAMAKKGLLEMKDGTMVLKQGIKLPTPDAMSLKALVGDKEAGKESPSKTDKQSLAQSNTN